MGSEAAVPPMSVAVPRTVEPSLNVTVPVGVPVPGEAGITTAVKTTGWPKTEGLADGITTDVVLSLPTF